MFSKEFYCFTVCSIEDIYSVLYSEVGIVSSSLMMGFIRVGAWIYSKSIILAFPVCFSSTITTCTVLLSELSPPIRRLYLSDRFPSTKDIVLIYEVFKVGNSWLTNSIIFSELGCRWIILSTLLVVTTC